MKKVAEEIPGYTYGKKTSPLPRFLSKSWRS